MSIAVMSRCFKTHGISSTQKFVLIALADNANDQGECFPSIPMLMEKCNLTERPVQKALVELIEQGHISREFRAGRSTLYRVHPRLKDTPFSETPPSLGHPTPVPETPPPPSLGHPTPVFGTPITIKEPSVESSGNRHGSPDAELLFAEAWSSYPKRDGGNSKADALKAWKARVNEGESPQDMLAGVKRYAAYCVSRDMAGSRFVKQAATFFGPGKHYAEGWGQQQSSADDWWVKAGFAKRWEAENAGCTETNSWLWRGGRPTKRLAGVTIEPWEAVQ